MTTETTTAATTAATTTAATTTTAAPGTFDFSAHGVAGDDLGYVQNKGFKGPNDLVSAYRNLESFVGDRDSLIRLPKERTPENMRKDVYSKLGWSDKVDDYVKALPVTEGDAASANFAKAAASWGHELGIPVETMKELATRFAAHGGDLVKTTGEATAAGHREQLVALQKEKGATWEDTLKLVDGVAQKFQMSSAEIEGLKGSMGPAAAINFLERIGKGMGVEGARVESEDPASPNFRMTPAAALQKIASLKADPTWANRFLGGDSAARAESEALHKLAYPEG